MRRLGEILLAIGLFLTPLAAKGSELADKKAPPKESKKKKTNPKGIDSSGIGEKPAPKKKAGK